MSVRVPPRSGYQQKPGGYAIVPAGCGGAQGFPTFPPRDSIPIEDDKKWKEIIVYGEEAKYGNFIHAAALHLKGTDEENVLKGIKEGWQVAVVRDPETNTLFLVSFVDREREKELFGDEQVRGIERVNHCIPEIYRANEGLKRVTAKKPALKEVAV